MDDVHRVKAPASDGWVPGPPFVWADIVMPVVSVPVPVFPIDGRVSPGGIALRAVWQNPQNRFSLIIFHPAPIFRALACAGRVVDYFHLSLRTFAGHTVVAICNQICTSILYRLQKYFISSQKKLVGIY